MPGHEEGDHLWSLLVSSLSKVYLTCQCPQGLPNPLAKRRCSVSLLTCMTCGRQAPTCTVKTKKWRNYSEGWLSLQAILTETLSFGKIWVPSQSTVYSFHKSPVCSCFFSKSACHLSVMFIRKSVPFLSVELDRCSHGDHTCAASTKIDRTFHSPTDLFHVPLDCYLTPKGNCKRLVMPAFNAWQEWNHLVYFSLWLACFTQQFVGEIYPHSCVCSVWLLFMPLCSFCCGWTVSRFWLIYKCNFEHFLHVPSLTYVCVSHTYRPKCGITRLKTEGIFQFSSYCLACF